jgi:nicotinamidase-related amidase
MVNVRVSIRQKAEIALAFAQTDFVKFYMLKKFNHTALLLVDVQKYYADDSPQTVTNIANACAAVRGRMAIIWVYWAPYASWHFDLNADLKTQPPFCVGDNPTQQRESKLTLDAHLMTPSLRPAASDWVTGKNNMSAFTNPALATFLKQAGIRHLVIGGFATSACVRATAIEAKEHGLHTRLALDLTADYDDGKTTHSPIWRFPQQHIGLLEGRWWETNKRLKSAPSSVALV